MSVKSVSSGSSSAKSSERRSERRDEDDRSSSTGSTTRSEGAEEARSADESREAGASGDGGESRSGRSEDRRASGVLARVEAESRRAEERRREDQHRARADPERRRRTLERVNADGHVALRQAMLQRRLDEARVPAASTTTGEAGSIGATTSTGEAGAMTDAEAAERAQADAAEIRAIERRGEYGEEDLARLEAIRENLEAHAENEAYAAAFFEELGPEHAGRLPNLLGDIARVDFGKEGELDVDYDAFGSALSVALGTASQSGELSSDYAARLAEAAGPASEVIYLSEGTFEPEFAAELADDVFRRHDPNLNAQAQGFSDGRGGDLFGFTHPAVAGAGTTLDVALGAIERSGAEVALLARDGIAEAVLHPSREIDDLWVAERMGALLDAPRDAIARGEGGEDAITGAAAIIAATLTHGGEVASHGRAAVAGLYVDHADAILNLGRGSAAWPSDSPLADEMAFMEVPAGSAHMIIGVGSEASPAWRERMKNATGAVRDAVLAQASQIEDREDAIVWAQEIAHINTELVQGLAWPALRDARGADARNEGLQNAIDFATDVVGETPLMAALGKFGPLFTAYDIVLEGPILEGALPTGAGDDVASDLDQSLLRAINTTQLEVFDGMVQAGLAEDFPPEWLIDQSDPSQGIRLPSSPEEAEALIPELRAYLESLPDNHQVRVALDAAANELEKTIFDP